MTPHPAADLFPSMTEEEYADLREDIERNGLQDPIRTYQGQILDGRHRLRACEELGLPPLFKEYEGADLVGLVVSLNLKRRLLTESQRARLAATVANMTHGGDRKSDQAAPVRLEAQQGQPLALVPKVSQAQAARQFGVSERLVSDAKALQRIDPDLDARVERGELTIKAAIREVKSRTFPPADPARTDQNFIYREALNKAISGAEELRARLSLVVRSRPENRVQLPECDPIFPEDYPTPTDAVAREREGELKALLERIAALGTKIPGGRMVPANAHLPEGEP